MDLVPLRQLNREQILQAFVGQDMARCFVELIRLTDREPTLVFSGDALLGFQWSSGPTIRRRRAADPSTPRLVLITVVEHSWAEYAVEHDLQGSGDLVCEDYLMRLYGPDGQGPEITAEITAIDEQAAALRITIADEFRGFGAETVRIGKTVILTNP